MYIFREKKKQKCDFLSENLRLKICDKVCRNDIKILIFFILICRIRVNVRQINSIENSKGRS